MKLPYHEGSVFLVPIKNGEYARGVVARMPGQGKVLFGYFFGPPLKSTDAIPVHDLHPAAAVLKCQFGDLGLINGQWPVVGNVPGWNRSEWPMPDFVRRDPLSRKAWLVRYSDNDPMQIETEIPTDFESTLPPDTMSGYGAVEIKLSRLLG